MCVCVCFVSTCLSAPCIHWAQKTPEGWKTVKTGPVLHREKPAWHTLHRHTHTETHMHRQRQHEHTNGTCFSCVRSFSLICHFFFPSSKREENDITESAEGKSVTSTISFPVIPHQRCRHARCFNETIHVFYPSFHRSLCKVPIRFQWFEE